MFFVFLAAVIVAPTEYAPRPISEADKTAIRREADDLLFDAPSARWRWPERRHPDIYCGEVNAKNRLGAYTGWKPFVWAHGLFRIAEPGATVFYEAMCSTGGYIPKPDWLKD